MNIICFTDSIGSGGAQRQLVGLACMLKEHRHEVTVLTYYDNPFYKHILDAADINTDTICNNGNYFKRIYLLYKYLRNFPDCVLIAYQETPSLIACFVRPLLKIKTLIVSERNTTQTVTIKDKLRFMLWRFADFVVPNSQSQANFILSNVNILSSKVVPITNFVDLDTFFPKETGNRNNIISDVASEKKEKNFEGVIRAAKILKSQNKSFAIKWYGVNTLSLNKCRTLIEESGLADYIQVFEPVKDISKVYWDSDYFCLPSFFEGFPNVLCEAMSCGLPVACSNVCDNPYIVNEKENGFLFDPASPESIANAISSLLAMSDSQYADMAAANRRRALSLFSKSTFVSKYLELLR